MTEQKTDCTSRALDSAAAVWEWVNELASVCRDLRRAHEPSHLRAHGAGCTSRALEAADAVRDSVHELASVCRDLRRSHEAMSTRLRAAERSRAPDDALREIKTSADGVTYNYVDSVLVRAAVFHLVVDWLVAGCVEVDLRHVRDEILKLKAEAD